MLMADPENLFWKGGPQNLRAAFVGEEAPPPLSPTPPNYIVSLENVRVLLNNMTLIS